MFTLVLRLVNRVRGRLGTSADPPGPCDLDRVVGITGEGSEAVITGLPSRPMTPGGGP
jgi:hypothetical protein